MTKHNSHYSSMWYRQYMLCKWMKYENECSDEFDHSTYLAHEIRYGEFKNRAKEEMAELLLLTILNEGFYSHRIGEHDILYRTNFDRVCTNLIKSHFSEFYTSCMEMKDELNSNV